jgi:hypothetical protein
MENTVTSIVCRMESGLRQMLKKLRSIIGVRPIKDGLRAAFVRSVFSVYREESELKPMVEKP